MVKERKIAFIICVNDDQYYEECLYYINSLYLPQGYEKEIIAVTEAESMASAYNAAMKSSDAKYKVYLHQDVFIYHKRFIEDIIRVFQADACLGMLGVVGGINLPANAVVFNAWNKGTAYVCNYFNALKLFLEQDKDVPYTKVEAIDGMLMATQYDVPWREDLNLGFDFYDVSQSLEFRRKGYQVGIPFQSEPWCMHDCGISKLKHYDEARRVILREYGDFFSEKFVPMFDGYNELLELQDEIFLQLKESIEKGEFERASQIKSTVQKERDKVKDNNLLYAVNLTEIYEMERTRSAETAGFFEGGLQWSEAKQKYIAVKFAVRHMENDTAPEQEEALVRMVKNGEISRQAVLSIASHSIIDIEKIKRKLYQCENEVDYILIRVKEYVEETRRILENGQVNEEEFRARLTGLVTIMGNLEEVIPVVLYENYKEFFQNFIIFCQQCERADFLLKNMDTMVSSLDLLAECLENLQNECHIRRKKCICCGNEVVYLPLPAYYENMSQKYMGDYVPKNETLNKDEYSCPVCGASDRDRMIVAFLEKVRLQETGEKMKILQIAPSRVIENWILAKCPQVIYESTDLLMENVTFQSDIQNMSMVQDESYDIIICSHVLEHVKNDWAALSELKRILKLGGLIVFLVPIDLNADFIDEEWGLSEEENWRRFGQGDHCRRYDKKGLLQRLERQFCVHSLGKEYFGEELYYEEGLTDTSVLYVLTKDADVVLDVSEKIEVDQDMCKNGPLVSVVMSCYNHADFVGAAIESVIGQSYKNIEFLVADDGSSDNSAAIMQRYSNYFTKAYYYEDNVGGRQRQLMREAKGKYIALMNSDDIWNPDKLALQVEYMEKHEECGACFTWCSYVDENLRKVEDDSFIQKNRNQSEWMKYFWVHGNALCNPSSLVKRELRNRPVKYGGICWQLPDFFEWVELIQDCEFHIIPKVLIEMRKYEKKEVVNSSAVTSQNIIRHLAEEGCNWICVIRDMDSSFFKEAFADMMIHPEADTQEEILCEKYFIMLKHKNLFVQNSALCYLCEIYSEVSEVLEKKYNYTIKQIKVDMVQRGLASLMKL